MPSRIEKAIHRHLTTAEKSEKRSIGFDSELGWIINAWYIDTKSWFGRGWTAFVTRCHDRRTYTFLHICKFIGAGYQGRIRSHVRAGPLTRSNGNRSECHQTSKRAAAGIRRIDSRNKDVGIVSLSRITWWITWIFQFVRLEKKFGLLNQFDKQ